MILLAGALLFLKTTIPLAADSSSEHPESLQQNLSGVARDVNPKPGSGTAATNAAVGSAEWLEKTLALGDMKAVVNVGSNFLFGTGVPRDQKWAVTLFISAAVCGDSEAKRFMGYAYASGSSVPQDGLRAMDWFESAAREGNAKAQLNLGELYSMVSPPDYSNSFRWISLSAEQGFAPAQYDMGTMYESGVAVKPDRVKAMAWLQLAADGGSKDAIRERDLLAVIIEPAEKKQAELQVKAFKPAASKPVADDKGEATCPLDEDLRIPVKIFGESKYLVVDTGSPFTLFDCQYTNRLGEGLLEMASPTMNAMLYAGPEIFISQRRFSPLLVSVVDTRKMREILGRQIDGILGMDCLSNCVICFDSDHGAFTIGGSVPESRKQNAMAVPLKNASGGGYAIDAFLNGRGPVLLKIDSGYNGSISMSEADWKKTYPADITAYRTANVLRYGPHMEEIIEEQKSVRLRAMMIGSNSYTNLIADLSNSNAVSSLGQGFIKRHICAIDFPHRLIYLLHGSNFARPEEMDMSGLYLLDKDGDIVVNSVDKGSPAFRAGVSAGDKIMQINGHEARALGLAAINRILKANPGDRIKMQTIHQGVIKHYKFTLIRVL